MLTLPFTFGQNAGQCIRNAFRVGWMAKQQAIGISKDVHNVYRVESSIYVKMTEISQQSIFIASLSGCDVIAR